MAIEYAGAAKPRDFDWPDEAQAYIEELMAKWEGPPIAGFAELISELERLNARSRARWQEVHATAECEKAATREVSKCQSNRK